MCDPSGRPGGDVPQDPGGDPARGDRKRAGLGGERGAAKAACRCAQAGDLPRGREREYARSPMPVERGNDREQGPSDL